MRGRHLQRFVHGLGLRPVNEGIPSKQLRNASRKHDWLHATLCRPNTPCNGFRSGHVLQNLDGPNAPPPREFPAPQQFLAVRPAVPAPYHRPGRVRNRLTHCHAGFITRHRPPPGLREGAWIDLCTLGHPRSPGRAMIHQSVGHHDLLPRAPWVKLVTAQSGRFHSWRTVMNHSPFCQIFKKSPLRAVSGR